MIELVASIRGYIIAIVFIAIGTITILEAYECNIMGYKFKGFEHEAKQALLKKDEPINEENMKDEKNLTEKIAKLFGTIFFISGVYILIQTLFAGIP